MKTKNTYRAGLERLIVNRFKGFISILILYLMIGSVKGQGIAINSTGASPDAKAILDVSSTTQGFLMPRMTQAQRTAIASPTTGLVVYQTNTSGADLLGFYYYNGSAWRPLFDASRGWGLTGNSGTAAASNFIGTTDAVDFVIRTNNTEKMRVESGGDVGIGVTNPLYKLHVNGKIKSTGITESSDRRYKKDIVKIDRALDKVLALEGVMYHWKQESFPGIFTDSTLQMGLIAQEVEKIIPEVVETDKEGYKSVEYSHLVALLIEAMKEQEKTIADLKSELASKEDMEKLKKELAQLKAYVSQEAAK